ncbi:MAG: GtrA family protein [Roseovarius sp.]
MGLLNTGFGYGIFYGLLLLRLPPEVALLLAMVAGVLFNYLTTSRLVFQARGRRAILPFVASYVFVYALNAVVLRLMILAGISAALAQAFLVLPFALLTFLILRSWVFPGDLAAQENTGVIGARPSRGVPDLARPERMN